MAGKIIADTLEHSTAGSIATNYVVNGSAKSWLNANGTGTAQIDDSFQTSSITDNGTGNYTFTWTSAFGNAEYAPVGDANYSTDVVALTTTTYNFVTSTYATGGAADASNIVISVFGDLA